MSTTEHRPPSQADPSPAVSAPLVAYKPTPQQAEPAFTDESTGRIPAVPRRTGRTRPHRVQAGELAALAFTPPPPVIPGQREPSPLEFRAAG